jgi:CheY-like chemotaxis protein
MDVTTPPHGTVLYVDKEETAGKYLRASLSSDYELLLAHSARDALELLNNESLHIDVVVTDDRLPGNKESTILLKALEAHPYIECILLTADAPRELVAEQRRKGKEWQVFEKPVDLHAVSAAICGALVRSMRRQIRCQRFEAIKDTTQFFCHHISAQHTAIKRLCDQILDPDGDSLLDKRILQEQASDIARNSKRLKDDLIPNMRSALRNAGHAIEKTDTRITAGGLILDMVAKMSLTQEDRESVTVEIIEDFKIAQTAALTDLVLTNVLIAALASARRHRAPGTVKFKVFVQGAPIIEITDTGSGMNNPEHDLKPPASNRLLGAEGHSLRLCREVMTFLGGALLLSTYPVGQSQITLEFPPLDDGTYE